MKKLLLIVAVCIFFHNHLNAQTDEYWNFSKAALIFKNGNSVLDTNSNNCTTPTLSICHSSICDARGILLFYSNGYNLYNKNNQIVSNGNHFNHSTYGDTYINGNGGYPSIKGAVIIPFVKDTNRFYMFYEDLDYNEIGVTNYLPRRLRHLVINKSLNAGFGDVEYKDSTILDGDTLQNGNVFAIRHGNGKDWWIIVREFRTNKFYKILIDSTGIHTPLIQNIGIPYRVSSQVSDNSDVSMQGDKLAYLNTTFNFNVSSFSQLDLLDFDRCTGMLSNANTINIPAISGNDTLALWSCCFSPNGRFLYTTDAYKMWQLDLQSSNILNSRLKVGTFDGTKVLGIEAIFFQMKNGIDNKTYVSCYGGNSYIHVINYPDSLGLSCHFVQKQLYVGYWGHNHFQRGSLPNTPNFKLGVATCGVGINEVVTNEGLMVYPNPANDNLRIGQFENLKMIEVYDLIGRKLENLKMSRFEKEIQLNVSGLLSQIYILRITDEKGNVMTKKFVKE